MLIHVLKMDGTDKTEFSTEQINGADFSTAGQITFSIGRTAGGSKDTLIVKVTAAEWKNLFDGLNDLNNVPFLYIQESS